MSPKYEQEKVCVFW